MTWNLFIFLWKPENFGWENGKKKAKKNRFWSMLNGSSILPEDGFLVD
jgi:hypothetical protein